MKKMILLVEDNPDDEFLTLQAFQKNRIDNEIVVARDGVEALDFLFGSGKYADRDRAVLPVLVLLDLKLPFIDGLEVLRRLRQDPRTRLVPVVILSSSAEDGDVVTSYRFGANSYMQKPVDFQKFVENVERLGVYWLVLNEPPPAHAAGRTIRP